MDSEKKQEYTRRVTQANSTEMVVIIYDIALDYIVEAKDAINAGDDEKFRTSVRLLQGCLYELLQSLDLKYDLARDLRNLYGFCIRQLGISTAKRSTKELENVKNVLAPLRDAYSKITGENKKGPVMGNSETVFAGLTYGKEELIESLSTSPNRGFFA